MARRAGARLTGYAPGAVKRRPQALRVLTDLMRFAWEQRRWWLLPAIVASVVVAAALLLGASPAAPFLYTFF